MTQTEPLDASVTLDEIIAVVSQKRAPLAPELAGYLVLELAENVGPAASVDPKSVYVSEEGSVALVRGPGEPTGDADAVLRALLAKLLETAGAQTPALAAVARRRGGASGELVEELEAALIPVNRSAGKRALARLARETKRVTHRVGRNRSVPDIPASDAPVPVSQAETTPPPPPSNLPTVGISKEDLDAAASKTKRDSVDSLLDSFEASGKIEDKALSAELKAMAGLEPTPPPPVRAPSQPPDDADLEALLSNSAPKQPSAPPPALHHDTGRESPVARRKSDPAKAPNVPAVRAPAVSFANERQLQTAPSRVRQLQMSVGDVKPKKTGSNAAIFVLIILAFAGFAGALWLMKPGFLTGRTPEKIAQERAAAEAESARIAAQRAVPACHATLAVAGAPKDAEILVREGQAPVDVEHMPMGTRLEFVATAEGFAPKRGVVEPETAWDKGHGTPRVDLPIQLDKSKARAGAVDPWPPADPDTTLGSDKATPGTVHVITSPKGAEVWLVVGLGPEPKKGEPAEDVLIQDIGPCDTDMDVLVAGPTTYRKRMHVPASSFAVDSSKPGVRVAHVAVKP